MSRAPGGAMRHVAVVVPARNEEHELPGCLQALAVAASRAEAIGVRATVVVAADSCVDATGAIARTYGSTVVEIDSGAAGAARAAGFSAVFREMRTASGGVCDENGEGLWLATTDADSRVPADWLTRQLGWAALGWDGVAGTVRVTDWTGHPPGAAEAFAARYDTWRGRPPHIHGANLGFSGSAYLAVGGFRPSAVGEDHDLIRSLENKGFRVLRTAAIPVVTSARMETRAPTGFGHDLRDRAARQTAEP